MGDYINRGALLDRLNIRLDSLRRDNGDYDHYTCGYDDCIDAVEEFPISADVAPIVRGQWIGIHDGWGCCSNCRRMDAIDPAATHCRYCGAKMGGGSNV